MTLTDGVTTITLPDDLLWDDELAWDAVEQSVERSVTGALIVDLGTRNKGRPITLKSGDSYAWVNRATVLALKAIEATAAATLTLTLAPGRVYACMFRRHDGVAVEASPVMHTAPVDTDDRYLLTLRLMEI